MHMCFEESRAIAGHSQWNHRKKIKNARNCTWVCRVTKNRAPCASFLCVNRALCVPDLVAQCFVLACLCRYSQAGTPRVTVGGHYDAGGLGLKLDQMQFTFASRSYTLIAESPC